MIFSGAYNTANATLLGRLNAYYGNQIAQAGDPAQLLELKDTFQSQKSTIEDEIKKIGEEKTTQVEHDQQQAASAPSATSSQVKQFESQIQNLDDRKKQLDAILTAINDALAAQDELQTAQNGAATAAAEVVRDADKVREAEQDKTKSKPSDDVVENHKSTLSTARQVLDNKKLEVKSSYKKLNTLLVNEFILDETINGVQEGMGSATFISSNANTAVALNAYRFNVLLGAVSCRENHKDNAKNCITPTSNYRSIPLYIFLKKSTNTQVDDTTISNDLLDNEHGGTVGLKFSGARNTKFLFDFSGSNDPALKQYGTKLVYDFGIKLIEVPAVQVTGQPATTNSAYISAGYVGGGLNFELPIFSPTDLNSEFRQTITPGTKPAGGMAIGLGVYYNYSDNKQYTTSQFSKLISDEYGTIALMYEIHLTERFSLKGTRIAPAPSFMTLSHQNANTPGAYTSFQLGYKF